MAHFAQIDENNIVLQVIVVGNADTSDIDGVENESIGIAFCQELFPGTTWVQTSYNAKIRKNYAGRGYTFDANRNAFIPPKTEEFPSWILDETTCRWQAPIPYPVDGKTYIWDEPALLWKEISG